MARKPRKKATPDMQDAPGGKDAPPVVNDDPPAVDQSKFKMEPYPPPCNRGARLVPVGGATEPPRMTAEDHAAAFASTWEGVAVGDVLTILSFAVAACRIIGILVPLFMRQQSGMSVQYRRILMETKRHFPNKSVTFHEQFALELHEYIRGLVDNGMDREGMSMLIRELQQE